MNGRIVIVIVIVAAVVIGLVASKLSHSVELSPPQNDSLSTKRPVKPRFPATRMRFTDSITEHQMDNSQSTNIITRLMEDEQPRLTLEQVAAYLEKSRRNVESLLAAWRVTGDRSFMREAMEKYPNDPRVAFTVACLYNSFGNDEENAKGRRLWLETFKATAPDNALADYLSASEHFKSGQADQAMQDLLAVGNKPMQDYALDFIQNSQEAYLAAGYSEAEAKAIATSSLLLPQLAQFKQVSSSLVEVAKAYQQAGDPTSSQATFQMASNLGQCLDSSETLNLVQSLVGIAIQRNVLNAMNPNSPYGDSGQTVQNQIDALNERRVSLKDIAKQAEAVLPTMSEQDLSTYFDRQKIFGEAAALRWAVDRFGQKSSHQ